jgi:hypothetical protein
VQKVAREVAITDRIEGVVRQSLETETLAEELSIDTELIARARSGSERVGVGLVLGPLESSVIATEHLDVRQQMVREEHRLCAL